jgi:hypothetical protein
MEEYIMRRVQIEVSSSFEATAAGEDFVNIVVDDDGNVTLQGIGDEGTTFTVRWDRLEAQAIAREILAE